MESSKFFPVIGTSLANEVQTLLQQQKETWQLASKNYSALRNTSIKTIYFDAMRINAQYNPGRVTSTTAKTDSETIKNRSCFLCIKNLPEEQKGILFENDLIVLVNPYPVFPEHLTIVSKEHIPQLIKDYFGAFLKLCKEISPRFTLLYNGPECGASAPDHLHFQAGTRSFMPIEDDFHSLKNEYGKILFDSDDLCVAAVDDSLRRFISIESNSIEIMEKTFNKIYTLYLEIIFSHSNIRLHSETEAPMNIISSYEVEFGWRVIIFLREKHRSSHYYRKGEDKIVVSPAAIDIGGVVVTPLQKDFYAIDESLLTEIFNEVCLDKNKFEILIDRLSADMF